ncbi:MULTISPECIES: hypothetical protein [Chromobacterium]|uniref:DUF4142 domain-containing protein n=1 Tax=Chromobacterium rhizoryzae TaxID=1778675 RepID=A0AAD0RQ04_9NEIS|nr:MULTISPECIES: hypothetical protein [Chromobacterium]AXT44926.1 hypothetical protein D1345_01350 [Chromobacterium rhizoryzae]MBN3003945.1 hypothetical protein [Chromobacterium alkanivorans]MCS3805471.1 hypothetical protein [Chromobacterium alkanivorans]MCS3819810.1 hypothetical protein [Chromobacterium alkanivorans]MCS3874215.1 hypothetical protein [Chromobacterium alkanivorans]
MRKTLIALAVAAASLAAVPAHAGMFDAVTSLAGGNNNSAAGADLVSQQEQLVNSYVAANKEILLSQYKMANALGAKDAAALAKAEADALASGATKDNLSKADSVQSNVSKIISERQKASGSAMDAEAKKTYTEGLASLGKGLLKYAGMTKQFDGFKSALSSASPMDLPKLSTGSYILTSLPSNSKNLYETLKQAVSFAKSNDIPVPKDATQAL